MAECECHLKGEREEGKEDSCKSKMVQKSDNISLESCLLHI